MADDTAALVGRLNEARAALAAEQQKTAALAAQVSDLVVQVTAKTADAATADDARAKAVADRDTAAAALANAMTATDEARVALTAAATGYAVRTQALTDARDAALVASRAANERSATLSTELDKVKAELAAAPGRESTTIADLRATIVKMQNASDRLRAARAVMSDGEVLAIAKAARDKRAPTPADLDILVAYLTALNG